MTNLNAPSLVRGPVSEQCLDCMRQDFEPWCLPHFERHLTAAPAPAEAATEIGADDSDDELPVTWRDLLWVVAATLPGLTVFSMLCGYIVARLS